MANYIHLNILCQAYIHVEMPDAQVRSPADIKDYLEAYLGERAKFFLYPEVEIDYESSEGSIKAYLTVLGTLSAIYGGIAQYPDFREGIKLIYEDSKRLSEMVISEGLFASGARHADIIRLEARTGVVGSLKRIVDDLDILIEDSGNLTSRQIANRMIRANQEMEKLLENLKNDDDQALVTANLLDMAQQLPVNPKRKRSRHDTERYLAVYANNRRKLISFLKSN